MPKTKERVRGVADTARPYVDRALTDQELRDNVKNAFTAARDVYNELTGRRGVSGLATRVAVDKDIQENLRTAVDELRSAANRLQGREEHKSRNSLLLLVGIALGVLFNPVTGPETRRWLRERLFGGGSNEFGYETGGNSGTGPST
jgi:hypothetical protein